MGRTPLPPASRPPAGGNCPTAPRGVARISEKRFMQWLVQLALRRPYTMVVLALLIGLMGCVTIARMPTDIFPNIDIPVVTVIWQLNGIKPDEMEKRIVTICERAMTTTVN